MARPICGTKLLEAEGWHRGHDGKMYRKKARWDGQPMRCPKKGEYFISGAIPTAYRAANDLTTPYYIATIVEGEY